MSRPPILSQEDIQEIKTLYLQGRKVSDLATNYLVDRKTIHYHLFHAGLLKKQPKKERVYAVRKRTERPQTQSSINQAMDRKAKNVWLWKEEKKTLSYAERCKKNGINLKKYLRAQGFTTEEKLFNKGDKKFF
jgi:hypothetical protein